MHTVKHNIGILEILKALKSKVVKYIKMLLVTCNWTNHMYSAPTRQRWYEQNKCLLETSQDIVRLITSWKYWKRLILRYKVRVECG